MDASPALLYLLLSVTGLVVGFLLAWLAVQFRVSKTHLERTAVDREFVRRELHDQLRSDADLHYENLQEKVEAEARLRTQLATLTAEHRALREKLDGQQAEMERLQAASVAQFERTADRLLQEKGERFTLQNAPSARQPADAPQRADTRIRTAGGAQVHAGNRGPDYPARRD